MRANAWRFFSASSRYIGFSPLDRDAAHQALLVADIGAPMQGAAIVPLQHIGPDV
jgi:hypothetical protein